MTIHELLAAVDLTANDEIPIWDAEATDEPTRKITAQQMAAALIALGNLPTGVKGDAESTYRHGNVNITKANIGLGNVDNTNDMAKPVSTATQAAINEVAGDAGIDRAAFNYAYMLMQAELRDVQRRLEIVEGQLSAMT